MKSGAVAVLGAAAVVGAVFWLAGSERPPAPAGRIPPHPPERPRDDPAVRAALEAIGRLRALRAAREIPPGGVGDAAYADALDRLRAQAPAALHYVEEAALDRRENPWLRVDLLNLAAARRDDATRRFLLLLFSDREEPPRIRLAALAALGPYRDAETFEALRRAYEDPAPFEGRYQICAALAATGRPEALPILEASLEPSRPLDVRCHAAEGLAHFADRPEARERLARLAREDAAPAVRQNALRALARAGAEEILKERAEREADEETRSLARRLLEQRERKP